MTNTPQQIKDLATWMMASQGMLSLVINAPEDSDDHWRVYPSRHSRSPLLRCIGRGLTLEEAVDNAHSRWLKIHERPKYA